MIESPTVCHCLQPFIHVEKHCCQIVATLGGKQCFCIDFSPQQWHTSSALRFAISSAHADVIVLANRTPAPVGFRFVPKSGEAQQLTLPVGETMPLYLDGKADVVFAANGGQKRYTLDANCAYYFGRGQRWPRRFAKNRLRRGRHRGRRPQVARRARAVHQRSRYP